MTTTEQQYPHALDALTTATRAILGLANLFDISELRTICGRFETIAPITEPTAYIRGGMTNLRDQAAFLAAVDEFVTKVRSLDRQDATR